MSSTCLPAALGLAFVTSVNILITSRVVEHFQGRHRPLRAADADGELGAYGIANLCAGVFGAPMSVGIPARSLANVRCGGTTRLSNFLHAAFLLVLVGFGSGLIARIPLAALAGVTAYVGLGLLEWSTWRRLHRMRRLDATAFLMTALAVITSNAVAAVAIGCSLYRPPPSRQQARPTPPPLGNRAARGGLVISIQTVTKPFGVEIPADERLAEQPKIPMHDTWRAHTLCRVEKQPFGCI